MEEKPSSTSTEISVPKSDLAKVPVSESAMMASQGMMNLIERLATSPDVDVQKMTALLDMQERIWNRTAEMAFNRDFDALSQVLPRIEKRGSVGYEDKKTGVVSEAFKFARFEDIDETVRPLIHEYGFSLSFTSDVRDGGGIVVTGTLSHREGHKKILKLPLALDGSGGKNNLQGMGSSLSYGRRYATCILLNIITISEDKDGAGAGEEPIDNEQAVKVDVLLRESGADRVKFLEYIGTDDVQKIKAKDFDRAINLLEQKKAAKIAAEKKAAEAKGDKLI